MDVRAAAKVEDDMSQSWLELIDEEEDALLNEAVSHTIRQLSAEIRSTNSNSCLPEKTGSKKCDYHEIVKPVENCLRINEGQENGEVDHSLGRNKVKSVGALERKVEKDTIDKKEEAEEEEERSSTPFRKRPREDNFNSLPAKISRNRHNSSSSSSTNSSSTSKKKIEYETDPATLIRRQKDIDYGKNTIGYDKYIQAIPKLVAGDEIFMRLRKDRAKEHPKTPPKYVKYSRRGWDGMVKLWRKQLHAWDPAEDNNSSVAEDKDRATE